MRGGEDVDRVFYSAVGHVVGGGAAMADDGAEAEEGRFRLFCPFF